MAFIDLDRLIHSEDIHEILSILKKYGVFSYDSKYDQMSFYSTPFTIELSKRIKRNGLAYNTFLRACRLVDTSFHNEHNLLEEVKDILDDLCNQNRNKETEISICITIVLIVFILIDEHIGVQSCCFNPFHVITVSQKVLDWTDRIKSKYPLKADNLQIEGFNPLIVTPHGFAFTGEKVSFLFATRCGSNSQLIARELGLLAKTVSLIDSGITIVDNNQLTMTPRSAAVFEAVSRQSDDVKKEWWVNWFVRLQPVGQGRKAHALVPVRGHFRHRAA